MSGFEKVSSLILIKSFGILIATLKSVIIFLSCSELYFPIEKSNLKNSIGI